MAQAAFLLMLPLAVIAYSKLRLALAVRRRGIAGPALVLALARRRLWHQFVAIVAMLARGGVALALHPERLPPHPWRSRGSRRRPEHLPTQIGAAWTDAVRRVRLVSAQCAASAARHGCVVAACQAEPVVDRRAARGGLQGAAALR